jgi:hypothetical protein
MIRTTMAALLVATFAGAAPALAVQDGMLALATANARPIDRAAALRAQAEDLYSQPRQWNRAAGLLERSAEIGGATDAHGYMSLVLAGRLRAAIGDYAGARSNLEKAAAHALARGQVLDAANAYIDAAYAAAATRQPKDARALLDSAALLAESSLLSAEQSSQINRRIPTE